MTVIERYECDVTEQILESDQVVEVVIRTHVGNPFQINERVFHIDKEEFGYNTLCQPDKFEWVGGQSQYNEKTDEVERRVVGAMYQIGHPGDRHPQWYDRDSIHLDNYEEFFTVVEQELIW